MKKLKQLLDITQLNSNEEQLAIDSVIEWLTQKLQEAEKSDWYGKAWYTSIYSGLLEELK
jgi:hypothetical protein